MPTLGTLLASYARDLRARRRSARTIDIYRYGIVQFCLFLGGEPESVQLDAFTRRNLKAWVEATTEVWKPNTIRTHFAGVKRFGKWLVDEEYLEKNPADNVVLPTEQEQAPQILSDDELRQILATVDGKDFTSRRDTALVRVLLDTGARAAEVAGMTVSALDLDAETIIITGKGAKVRPLYFSPKTVVALDRFVRVRSTHRYAGLDNLWLTQRGSLDAKGVLDRIKDIGVRAGVAGLHPHRFRHTWAHDHLLNETSTVDLKRLAGWSSDAMLSRYGRSGADVRAAAAARRAQRGDRV